MEKNLKREKLFEQMEFYPYTLPELDPNKLLLFLKTEKKTSKLQFKHYSEFLNIMNTLIFFYVIILFKIDM